MNRGAPIPVAAGPPGADRGRRASRTHRRLRGYLVRAGLATVGVVLALGGAFYLGVRGVYDLPYAESVLPSLFSGFLTTLQLVAVIIPVGFGLGFVIGWARTLRSGAARAVAGAYVDFFRSLPPIVLIAFAFIIGQLVFRNTFATYYDAQRAALWLAVFALAFHTSAYQAEIVRAGIQSVPSAQTEAADAIGLGRPRTMFRIVLPQAFRVALPALGNEFSSVIKDSSLLSVVGWFELSGIGLVQVYSGIRVWVYAPLLIWIEVGVFYFVVTFVITSVVRAIENSVAVPGLEAVRT